MSSVKIKESICEECKQPFTYQPKNHKGRFCSKSCFKVYRRKDYDLLYRGAPEKQEPVIKEVPVVKTAWEVMVDKLRTIFRR